MTKIILTVVQRWGITEGRSTPGEWQERAGIASGAYTNTATLVVSGSVAMGSHENDGDLDIVWVYRGK